MGAVINLKKRTNFYIKELIVVLTAIILTTLGIRAADNFSLDKSAEDSVCDKGMVLVMASDGDFCIDKYEASAGPDCPYINPKNQTETRDNINKINCKPQSVAQKEPWRSISREQAMIACAKAGKKLPTAKEWYAAAMGTPDKQSDWTKDDCQVNNNWPNQPGLTGFGKNCVSAAGAYDMIGNVWEWIDATVDNGKYQDRELPDKGYVVLVDENGLPAKTDINKADINYYNDFLWIKKTGLRGIVRGGYWNNKSEAGLYSAYIVSPPSSAENGIGFRCVK